MGIREDVAAALAELQAEVDRNTSVDGSAVALIAGLADQILAAANDPAAVRALANALKASTDSLAAAVSANTPAPPAEPPA
jgi:hypothetical protein